MEQDLSWSNFGLASCRRLCSYCLIGPLNGDQVLSTIAFSHLTNMKPSRNVFNILETKLGG